MSRALFVGLSTVVREYLEVLAGRSEPGLWSRSVRSVRLEADRDPVRL